MIHETIIEGTDRGPLPPILAGETVALAYTLTIADSPYDLTGATLAGYLGRILQPGTQYVALPPGAFDVVNAVGGQVTVRMTAEFTAALSGDYVLRVKAKAADGTVTAFVDADWTVKPDALGAMA